MAMRYYSPEFKADAIILHRSRPGAERCSPTRGSATRGVDSANGRLSLVGYERRHTERARNDSTELAETA